MNELSKNELFKKIKELYNGKEPTVKDLEEIILNMKTKIEIIALDAVIRMKYQCYDMEAGAIMQGLQQEVEWEKDKYDEVNE